MNNKPLGILLLIAVTTATAATRAPTSLAEVETLLRQSAWYAGDADLPDLAHVNVNDAAAASMTPWRGTSVFVNSTVSSNNEVVDVGRRRTYEQLGLSTGVRVPLFGSRERIAMETRQEGLALLGATTVLEMQRRALLTQGREAYLALWAASMRRDLAADYQRTRVTLEPLLLRRRDAGLLLESDRLEFMAGFANVAAELGRAHTDSQTAAATLTMLTGLAPGKPAAPQLAASCLYLPLTPRNIDALLEQHPEVRLARQREEHWQRTRSSTHLRSLRSDLRLGVTGTLEPRSGEPGHSLFASLQFEYELGRARADHDAERVARAASRLSEQRLRTELTGELLAMASQLAPLEENARVAKLEREAAEARLRERSLRTAKLAGDVIEQLQQARYQLYRSQLAELQARQNIIAWRIAMQALAPADCAGTTSRPARLSDVEPGVPDAGPDRAVYVWQSAALLTELAAGRQPTMSQRLRALGIRRLLVSLDAAQLAQYRSDPATLRAALDTAHGMGYAVELLLGEPRWMLPEHRSTLLEHIAAMGTVPFDGLHLDLEPSQLDHTGGSGQMHVPALVATLREVSALSPWPIGLSIHPRDLQVRVDGLPVAEHLQQLAIAPTLMIYVSNTEQALQAVQSATAGWPALRPRVAVSVERELDAGHSLVSQDTAALTQHLLRIESLHGEQMSGITIQSSPGWLEEDLRLHTAQARSAR